MKYYVVYSKMSNKEHTLIYKVRVDNKQKYFFFVKIRIKGHKKIKRLNQLINKTSEICYAESCDENYYKTWKNITEEEFVRDINRGTFSKLSKEYLSKILSNKIFN